MSVKEIEAVEQLHHEVEAARLADPEVVEAHGVWRGETRDRPGLQPEAPHGGVAISSEAIGADKLHRTGPREQLVAGAPDLAHPALAQLLDQPVVTEGKPLVEERLVDLEHRLARGDDGPLEHGLQLTHVARPTVSLHPLQRLVRDPLDHRSEPPGVLAHEEPGEVGDVLGPLRERGYTELPGLEPRE